MRTLLLALALTACAHTRTEDAGVDAGSDAATPDDAFAPDASIADILCTGMPVPEGLPCPTQDPATTNRCGAEGGVVFSGHRCLPTQGTACDGARGAFNTLEECAVSCARAGHCNAVTRGVIGEVIVVPCDTNELVCRGLVTTWPVDSSRCAYIGRVERTGVQVSLTDFTHPEEWEFIRATTLMPFTFPEVACIE